jgi:hypothetical protein
MEMSAICAICRYTYTYYQQDRTMRCVCPKCLKQNQDKIMRKDDLNEVVEELQKISELLTKLADYIQQDQKSTQEKLVDKEQERQKQLLKG